MDRRFSAYQLYPLQTRNTHYNKGLSERLKLFGSVESLSLLESQNENALHHYKYRVEFADGPMMVDLYLNRGKKITALQVRSE
jgi:hypothetical protein